MTIDELILLDNIEQEKANEAETIKEKGYALYHNGKTLKDKIEGIEIVIEGCWMRESMFPLIPPTLQEYRKHYITANRNRWDHEVMDALIKKYGTVTNPRIREGYRQWQG